MRCASTEGNVRWLRSARFAVGSRFASVSLSSSHFTSLKVQATEKSFAETREKAKKLADDEQKKKTKDLPGHRQNQKSLGHRSIASNVKPFSRPSNSLAPRSSDGHSKVHLLAVYKE